MAPHASLLTRNEEHLIWSTSKKLVHVAAFSISAVGCVYETRIMQLSPTRWVTEDLDIHVGSCKLSVLSRTNFTY